MGVITRKADDDAKGEIVLSVDKDGGRSLNIGGGYGMGQIHLYTNQRGKNSIVVTGTEGHGRILLAFNRDGVKTITVIDKNDQQHEICQIDAELSDDDNALLNPG